MRMTINKGLGVQYALMNVEKMTGSNDSKSL
jgi:hypothetical protein